MLAADDLRRDSFNVYDRLLKITNRLQASSKQSDVYSLGAVIDEWVGVYEGDKEYFPRDKTDYAKMIALLKVTAHHVTISLIQNSLFIN